MSGLKIQALQRQVLGRAVCTKSGYLSNFEEKHAHRRRDTRGKLAISLEDIKFMRFRQDGFVTG
jgi:hypothetical protein